ncbi:hypothetical protein [Spirosoma fluminis]
MAQLIDKPEHSEPSSRSQSSRRPDYLLWLMVGLFLLAVLIGVLTDVPSMLW